MQCDVHLVHQEQEQEQKQDVHTEPNVTLDNPGLVINSKNSAVVKQWGEENIALVWFSTSDSCLVG